MKKMYVVLFVLVVALGVIAFANPCAHPRL